MRIHKHMLTTIFLLIPAVACEKSEQPKEEAAQLEAVQAKVAEPEGAEPEVADPKEKVLASLDPRVKRASDLAAQLEGDPESSEQILAKANLDREGLDELMYEIAIDPELTSQYRTARGLQ